MSKFVDAAELAKAIRDELVTWDGAESGSRQLGSPTHSIIDIHTDDGKTFYVTVDGPTDAEG